MFKLQGGAGSGLECLIVEEQAKMKIFKNAYFGAIGSTFQSIELI
jgi:hypothetical protein